MGLDSFIVARRKDSPEIEIELYYERKFFELDNILRRGTEVPNEEYEYFVTLDQLKEIESDMGEFGKTVLIMEDIELKLCSENLGALLRLNKWKDNLPLILSEDDDDSWALSDNETYCKAIKMRRFLEFVHTFYNIWESGKDKWDFVYISSF